jgi:hypothetical protein
MGIGDSHGRNAFSACCPIRRGLERPLIGPVYANLPLDRRAETLAGAFFASALSARPLPMLS